MDRPPLTIPQWDLLLALEALEGASVETLLLKIELAQDELELAFYRDLRELAAAGLVTLNGSGDQARVDLTPAGQAAVASWRELIKLRVPAPLHEPS